MVSIAKLEKDFHEYSNEELGKLTAKELDKYIESIILAMYKDYRKGVIYGTDDYIQYSKILSNTLKAVKGKFSNADAVSLSREAKYLYNAYILSNLRIRMNRVPADIIFLSTVTASIQLLLTTLKEILYIYYLNYSNSDYLEKLFYSLSDTHDFPFTFKIHDKYAFDSEFSTDKNLMRDLDLFIEGRVNRIFYLMENIEKSIDLSFTDDTFDEVVNYERDFLNGLFNKEDEFDTKMYLQLGFGEISLMYIENCKSFNDGVKTYKKIKSEFMDLYEGNSFDFISKDIFEDIKKDDPNADWNKFMEKQPKYNLKECKLIMPKIKQRNN